MLENSWPTVGLAAVHALRLLALNPLLYIGWILFAVALDQEAKYQRRFFGIRLWRVRRTLFRLIGRSLLAGFCLSLGTVCLGVFVRPVDIVVFSILALVAGTIRFRFAAAPTVIGAMVILSALSRIWIPQGQGIFFAVWRQLLTLPIYSWLSLAALLSLAEAILLFTSKYDVAQPVLLESKRGRAIGAVSIHLMFVLPVLLCVAGDVPRPHIPSSWPWLGAWSGGIGLIGVPLFSGVGGVFAGQKPTQTVASSGRYSLGLFGVLGAAAAVALWLPNLGWIGGIIALVGREFVIRLHQRQENYREPIFVQSPQGVRVLAVVKGSLAETIGIRVGEVITHVNQIPIHSEYDLHFAYSQNPAYAKLQVMDETGESRIIGKAVYAGERVKLGVVSLPDVTGDRFAHPKFGLLHSLYVQRHRQSVDLDDLAPPIQ